MWWSGSQIMLVRLLHLNSTSHNLRLLSLASEPLPNKSMTIQSFFHKAFRFFFTISLVQLSLVLHVTLVQKVPPPLVPWPQLCPSHHLSLSEGRAPPQISFRNRRRGGRERRRDERRAELEHEHEEKENGPELLEERSRTRASAAAAAGRHREGERRCPRQAPARGVGEDPGLVGSG